MSGMREWYVNDQRQAVNLATLRAANGNATATVYRIVEQPGGALLLSQWVRSGETLSAFRVTQAQAAVSTDPIPADPVPATTLGTPALDPNTLTVGEATMPRSQIGSANVAVPAGSTVRLTYFTARKSGTYTQLRVLTGTTAAGATPTLCKLGLYSVAADGALTRVAVTANDPTLFATASAVYTRAATTSFSLVAGRRYAFAIIVVTTAALPSSVGYTVAPSAAAELALAPRIAGAVNTQTDLPTSVAAASVVNTAPVFYGVVL